MSDVNSLHQANFSLKDIVSGIRFEAGRSRDVESASCRKWVLLVDLSCLRTNQSKDRAATIEVQKQNLDSKVE